MGKSGNKSNPKQGWKREFRNNPKGSKKPKMRSKSTQTDNDITNYHVSGENNKRDTSIKTRTRRGKSLRGIENVKMETANEEPFCEICKVSLELSSGTLLEHLNSVHFRPQWGCDTLKLYKRLCNLPNLSIDVNNLKNSLEIIFSDEGNI